MGVRVLVELKRNNRVVSSAALVNSGYEADEPELHVPLALARVLGFKLEGLKGERYKVVGAEVTTFILGEVEVRVRAEDKVSEWVKAKAVSVPGEYEVILSDAITEQLGVEILKPRTGLWRFVGELKVRKSVEEKYWVE